MGTVKPEEVKELIIKCWMTHDGMWFMNCVQECGIEKANKVNKAAIRSLAPIEVKRVQKACGLENIQTFQELLQFLDAAQETVIGDFMGFGYHVPSENALHFGIESCFAHDGMKRIGVSETYECGIFTRIEAWFETLGIAYTVTPEVTGCMMVTEGRCFRDYSFTLG
jgi:hypothetical protein